MFANSDNPWTSWRPDVIVFVLLIAAIYALLHRRYAQSGKSVLSASEKSNGNPRSHWIRHTAFFLGLLLLYAAMAPLAQAAQTRLFTVFVFQMLLVTMVLPWLLIFSLPAAVLMRLLRANWLGALLTWLTRPLIALIFFNAVVTATLIPAVLNASVTIDWLHGVIENILFLAAVCFWWPLVYPTRAKKFSCGMQLLYLFFAANFMMPIIVVLLFSTQPWYAVYNQTPQSPAASAERMGDQQLGGVVMLGTMVAVYGGFGARLYLRQDESFWYA